MAATNSSLRPYRSRRNFAKTSEPRGTKNKTITRKKAPLFVIQKHAARQLHYDLRLEIDGTLVSWAIPKGPSLNPRMRRLAVRTENHPLDYAKFEGTIPEGEYGAGTVMVWDIGTYKNASEHNGRAISEQNALKNGEIKFILKGKKLVGKFVLIRTDYGKKTGEEWLLIKMKDDYASARRDPVKSQQKSVLTDRTMTQIKRDACKDKPCPEKKKRKPARTRSK